MAEHEHPAAPEQVDEGFAEGQAQGPDTAHDAAEPDFARGMHEEPHDEETRGRFSEGQEEQPDSPEKTVERRFSEGQEISPTSE